MLWLIVDPQKLFVKRQQTPKAEAHGPSSVPSKAVHSEKLRNFITIVSLDLLLFIKIIIKVVIEKSRGGRFLWKKELRFGLDLGGLAVRTEKKGPIMSNF